MRLPSINQYIDTLNSPFGLLRTIDGLEAERDCYRRVRFRSGNSAVVFKVFIGELPYMLKCYIKTGQSLNIKYEYINNIVAKCDFIVDARLLMNEIYIYDYNGGGAFFDVVLAPWIEGCPLDTEIKWAAKRRDQQALAGLASAFDRMALRLLKSEWAHGDIKPENMIVDENGKIHLIDYDALFIPSLSGCRTSEIGTKPFQHPARDNKMYNKHIDDYSIAMISVSLHALAADPPLYERFHQGDSIIMDSAEVVECQSAAFDHTIAMWSSSGQAPLYRLTQLLRSKTPCLNELESVFSIMMMTQATERSKQLTRQPNQTVKNSSGGGPAPVYSECALTPILVNGLWGYANSRSEIVVSPIFDQAMSFSEGLAAVLLGGKWHYIDRLGVMEINCAEYSAVKPFSHGLAAVMRDNLWGYIDSNKREVITPVYSMAGSFREELAVVRLDGKYGYINVLGKWYLEAVYDYATSFREKRAEVEKDGKVFYIDKLESVL